MLMFLAFIFAIFVTMAMIFRAQEKAWNARYMQAIEAKERFRSSLQSEEEVLTYDIYEALLDVKSAAASLNYRISNLFSY